MGITDNDVANPSTLTDVVYTVPDYYIPRVPTEIQQERKDSAERTRYIKRVSEERDMSWSAQRRREFEKMKERRADDASALTDFSV